jgi:hypothetical protein
MRAWTLGYGPAYERAVRVPGNAKAPGGYAFRTKHEAERYARAHAEDTVYEAWEMEIPGDDFLAATTQSWSKAAEARHRWHTQGPDRRAFMPECHICVPTAPVDLDCRLLLVEAPLINPDTGEPA